jgi:hypothetical protein
MQFIHVGSHAQAHSNIPYSHTFHSAATVQARPHLDITIPNTMQLARRKITMQVDDCVMQQSFDTETFERIIEYIAPDGTTVMTLTVDPRIWAQHEAPYARRRAQAK